MHLTGLDRFYWLTGFGAHMALLSVLLLRRHYRSFPIFTVFVSFSILRTVALFVVQAHGTKLVYFESFWGLGIIDTILELALILEMYFRTFRPLGRWPSDLKGPILAVACTSVAIAAGLTFLSTPPTRFWAQAIVIRGTFFSSAFMSELFVGMIALSVRFGLPWHSYVQKISQGLGVYSIVDFLIEAGHNLLGVGMDTHVYTMLSRLRMTAYLICVFYWIRALSRDLPAPRKMTERMRGQLVELGKFADDELRTIRARRQV